MGAVRCLNVLLLSFKEAFKDQTNKTNHDMVNKDTLLISVAQQKLKSCTVFPILYNSTVTRLLTTCF